LSSSGVAIAAAFAGAGAWSLVIQQCVFWIVKVAWLFPVSGFRPRLFCKPSLALPYLGFGLNAVGANLTDFTNKSLATVLVGGLIGVVAAGHYSMAYQIVRIPELIISGPLYLSIFTSVAHWSEDKNEAGSLAMRGFRGVVTALAPLFCGLALVAHLAVFVILGPTWMATAPILSLLTPAGFFLCIYSFVGAIFMGLGRSEYQFRLIALTGILLATGTLIGAHYGEQGVAAGFSIGAALAAPAYLRILSKQLCLPVRAILRETVAPIVATLAMAIALVAAEHRLPDWNPLVQLPVLILCGVAVYTFALSLIAGRQILGDLRWLLKPERPIGDGAR
jgi:O-antigen/teichoic acid export membrane protein